MYFIIRRIKNYAFINRLSIKFIIFFIIPSAMNAELSLKDGLERAVELIERASIRPTLVAVYGWPDAGKTYVINELKNYFLAQGYTVGSMESTAVPTTFELIRDHPSHYQIFLFHCAWDRSKQYSEKDRVRFWDMFPRKRDPDDPELLAEEILKREIDIFIGIYNPNHRSPKLKGNYDIIIRNPISLYKPYVSR